MGALLFSYGNVTRVNDATSKLCRIDLGSLQTSNSIIIYNHLKNMSAYNQHLFFASNVTLSIFSHFESLVGT